MANEGTVSNSTPSISNAPRMSQGSSSGSNPSGSVGSSSTSSSIRQSSASGTRQGSTGGTSKPDTLIGRNILTGEFEPKGKGVMSADRSIEQTASRFQPDTQGVYNPYEWRHYLEGQYGAENVSSSTLLKQGARGSKMTGVENKKTGIVYDLRANPDFTSVMKYETYLTVEQFYGKSARAQMRASTRNLRADIQSGTINATTFKPDQLAAINAGKAKIPGMTWHHDQQARRMQLIDEKAHKETSHIGSIGLGK